MQLVISFDNHLYFRDMIPGFLFIVMFDAMFLTNVGQRSASGAMPHECFLRCIPRSKSL